MEIFNDMRNLLLKLYNQALERIPLSEEEQLSIDDDLTDDGIDRVNDIIDSINRLPRYDRENFILLIVLFYYISAKCVYDDYKEYEENEELTEYIADDKEEYEEDVEEVDEIINLLETCDVDTVLNYIDLEGNTDLFDIITYFLGKDISALSRLGVTTISNYDEYNDYNKLLSSGIDIDDIIEKFHPNIEEEKLRYKKSKQDTELIEKYSKTKLKSYYDFAQLYTMVKQGLSINESKCDFIKSLLYENRENKKLIKTINLYMLKYIYLKKYLNNSDDLEQIKIDLSKKLHDSENIQSDTIEEFIDYDLMTFLAGYCKLPEEERNNIDDLISLDNLEKFGISGIWKQYDIKDRKLLVKYSPNWIEHIDNVNDCDICIYYSIDSKNEYKIPRLCIIMKDNKVVTVLGVRNNINIELEMLDVLDYKVQEYENSNELINNILSLKFLRYIKGQMDNNSSLARKEFEYLYGIDGNIDNELFGRYDDLIYELRRHINRRKYIANYFGCYESEVALSQEELNENTVVTTIFRVSGKTCNYPKLRVIFGSANAYLLESALGLRSLEFILEDANFKFLKSSKGLENLTFIGGDAYFESLEDTAYLNQDLNILGESRFKDGIEPNFTFKK